MFEPPPPADDPDATQILQLSRKALAKARHASWDSEPDHISPTWSEVGNTIRELSDRFGDRGLQVLMLGLADSILVVQGWVPEQDNVSYQPAFVDADNQATADDIDTVPAGPRWAARFVAARAAADWDTINALCAACESDDEFTGCVTGLVDVAAATLNALFGGPW